MATPLAGTVLLDSAQRAQLLTTARSQAAPYRLVLRSRIILDAAAGLPNTQIAARNRVHIDTVRTWRDRWIAHGPAGLTDLPRTGRPEVYGPEVRLRIIATVTSRTPEADTVWSHRLIAADLADAGISPAQVGRILADLDLKPHRVRGWLTRPADPDFFTKATDVCDLYLHKPANSIVVSIDEKTAIGARSRKHPTRPATPGHTARREFEYVRHGTVSIIAALDVHTGQIITEPIARNDSATFTAFLAMLDTHIDPKLTIHLIMDNGSSHTSKATRKWLAEHPRFVAHHTPKHASWLNQAELFFSTLTRRLLRHGEFTSRQDLIDKIEHFVNVYNRDDAKPYRLTYDGSPLKIT
jgi:transposase